MYVIKATQNAPSIALKIKSFSLIENVAPAAFELHDVVEKPRDRKPSRTPSCRKPIKHDEFHNVKSVACSIVFFFFSAGSVFGVGKVSKPAEHGRKNLAESMREKPRSQRNERQQGGDKTTACKVISLWPAEKSLQRQRDDKALSAPSRG